MNLQEPMKSSGQCLCVVRRGCVVLFVDFILSRLSLHSGKGSHWQRQPYIPAGQLELKGFHGNLWDLTRTMCPILSNHLVDWLGLGHMTGGCGQLHSEPLGLSKQEGNWGAVTKRKEKKSQEGKKLPLCSIKIHIFFICFLGLP